ncbi:MAG: efflux RND transporter periplasmic adaptor subunit [Alphaproteobacteria bacterium]
MTGVRPLSIVIFAAIAGAALALGIPAGGADEGGKPVLLRQSPPMGVGALGRVEPASRVRRLSHPGGMAATRLDHLMVGEGDTVEAGALLAEFADAPMKDAAVEQAVAEVAALRAQRDKALAAGRPTEIAAQKARIASLVAQEEISRRDAERSDELVRNGHTSAATAERNRSIARRAKADRRQAEADLESLQASRTEDLALAESRLAGAEAALLKARADAALTRVYAPIAGTILKVHAHAGDRVGDDGILEMADLERLDVVADVYETDLSRLVPDARAEIIVPGEKGRFAATVREIGWMVSRTTQAGTDPIAAVDARTVEVRLTLADEARQLLKHRTNMQVQVVILP